MAATYGYAGEFSSDEDIDRIEQQSERVVQSRFNDSFNSRPNAQQIEKTIEKIRSLSPDEDIDLTDELLAALLDHFKTQRGPIVDSTRNLYKKIAFRIIREGSRKENENNANNHNNNNIVINDTGLASKQRPQAIDSFSSDEEELPAPVVQGTLKKRINELVLDDESKPDEAGDENVEEMEVDQEAPHTGQLRETKQVDISTEDEEDDNTGESTGGSESDDSNSESEVLEVTPIKPSRQQAVITGGKSRAAPKQAHSESSVKRQPLAQSTPKDTTSSTAKKPYTRSQRMAAARAVTSSQKATDSFLTSKTSVSATNKSSRSSRRVYLFIGSAILVALLSFLIYRFRDNILAQSSAGRRLSINFG